MAKKKLKARGNFRKVTPAVAEKYIKYWAKRGVNAANEIPDGKDAAVQRIRLREALAVWRDFTNKMVAYEGEKAAYEAKLAEFKSLNDKKVFQHAGLPAKYMRPKAPVKPAKTGARSVLGGNFKRVTKKQAKNYLARLFNFSQRPLNQLDPGSHMKRAGGNATKFTPRIQEAVLLVGPEAATEMFVKAEKNRAKRAEAAAVKAKKAEERKKKADAAKLAKCQKQIERAQKRLEQLQNACTGISAARRARRSRRSSRRLRRRTRR